MAAEPTAGNSRPKGKQVKRPGARPRTKPGTVHMHGSETRMLDALIGADLSPLQAHDLVTAGLPVERVRELIASFDILDRDTLLHTIGVSERTIQRATSADKPLDANVSDRALRLASVTRQAIDVLGSREAAEGWLQAPAMGLDRRRPIDLLQSSEGTDLVKTLLTRMDYGVYT